MDILDLLHSLGLGRSVLIGAGRFEFIGTCGYVETSGLMIGGPLGQFKDGETRWVDLPV